MTIRRYQLETDVDYHQFCLEDEASAICGGDVWTSEALARHLAVAPGVVVIGCGRNTEVPLDVEIRDDEPMETCDA